MNDSKTISLSFRRVCVSIRFSKRGKTWYPLARRLFSGFLSSGCSASGYDGGEIAEVSCSSPRCFLRTYRCIIRYIVQKTLLRERGRLVALHASAVYRGKKVYVFLGRSGTGKSSACITLYRKGFRFITDDTLIVDVANQRFLVFPKPVELKRGGKTRFHLVDPKEREVDVRGRNLMFFILRRRIKTKGEYDDFIKILSRGDPEKRGVRVKSLDGVLWILKNTVSVRYVDQRAYLSLLTKRGNKFYFL